MLNLFQKKALPPFLVAAILISGYFLSQQIGNYYYQVQLEKINQEQQDVIANYRNFLKKYDAEPYLLVKKGVQLINHGYPQLATIPLKKAIKDKNFRDAYLYLGYAYLLQGDDVDKLDQSLIYFKKAESIDPIYPPTYQYLTQAYQALSQTSEAQQAQEKYEMLMKTYK